MTISAAFDLAVSRLLSDPLAATDQQRDLRVLALRLYYALTGASTVTLETAYDLAVSRLTSEQHDSPERDLRVLLANLNAAADAGEIVTAPGSDPPTTVYENSGVVGTEQYDAANQVMWKRMENDDTRQSFAVDMSGVITADLLDEDVNVYDDTTHEWTHEGVASGLWDDAGLLLAETEFYDDAAVSMFTIPIGTDIVEALNDYLDAGWVATGVAGVGSYTVTITGPVGKYPLMDSGSYFKTFHTAVIDEDLTSPTPLLTLTSGADPATELEGFGTVEGSATIVADEGSGNFLIVQAVGAPASDYPQVTTDEAKALVGADTKERIIPGAAVNPLPQWIYWSVANI